MLSLVLTAWAFFAVVIGYALVLDWARDGGRPPWTIVPASILLVPVLAVAVVLYALAWLLNQLSGGLLDKWLEG